MNAVLDRPLVITPQDLELKKRIIEVIRDHNNGVNFNELIYELDQEFDTFEIKEILWRLLSSGKVSLTPDRRLVIY